MVKVCVQLQILPHGKLAVERERLRHVADVLARLHIVGGHRLAEQFGGAFGDRSNPVIIFMVVVFPQPFEPRKPKISPRSMRTLTWSTATKSPNRRVNPSVSIAGCLVIALRRAAAR